MVERFLQPLARLCSEQPRTSGGNALIRVSLEQLLRPAMDLCMRAQIPSPPAPSAALRRASAAQASLPLAGALPTSTSGGALTWVASGAARDASSSARAPPASSAASAVVASDVGSVLDFKMRGGVSGYTLFSAYFTKTGAYLAVPPAERRAEVTRHWELLTPGEKSSWTSRAREQRTKMCAEHRAALLAAEVSASAAPPSAAADAFGPLSAARGARAHAAADALAPLCVAPPRWTLQDVLLAPAANAPSTTRRFLRHRARCVTPTRA
jgi:hypothetical protein